MSVIDLFYQILKFSLDLDTWINSPPVSRAESEDDDFMSSEKTSPEHHVEIASGWLPDDRPSYGGEVTKPAPTKEQVELVGLLIY